jgi:hypothetical protein
MVNPPIIVRIVVTLFLSFAFLASVAFAQSRMTVRWSEERLSVQAFGASVASVLREVARHTHVQIRGLEKVTGTADVEFAGKHLIEGLRVLLEDFNYVILLSSAESAPTILIHSRVAPGNAVADRSPQPGPGPDAADSMDTSEELATTDVRDQDKEEQVEAAERLDDASLESLRRVVLTGSTAARIAAMNGMAARHPEAAVASVAAAIDDPEPAVSGAAMQILSQIDHPGATETIGAMLRHPNSAVRRAALELLFLRNDPASVPYVVPIVDDPDPSFRARARELLKALEQSSKEK